MNKLSGIQKWILIILFAAFVGVFAYSQVGTLGKWGSTVADKETIRFSKDSGFYAEGFTVTLQSAPGTDVYYTMDGSDPTPDNQAASLYQGEILVELKDVEYSCTIRAAAYENGAMVSDMESRTYICGTNVHLRYDMPVLSVTGTPDDFYNYEDGIMVHGKMDDEYKAARPEAQELFEHNMRIVKGNFYQKGREAEKEVVVTLFDEDGKELLSQNAGFRVYGAVSRMKNQPSFRLYARSEYDEINDFDYAFFEDQYTAEGTVQSEYKRIIVRNSGDDNGFAFIRSELATRIAKEAGFTDAPSASPVCVYLNGEYYGVHWFISNFDDSYFTEVYGEYPGEMYIFEGVINEVLIDEEEEDSVYIQLAEEYNEQMSFFNKADLTDEENWQKLNAFMDVENFIKYTAVQHYVSNDDCLTNNYRVYRYYAPDGEYQEDTVFDGKYRLLMFDMDHALGLIPQWTYVEPEKFTLTAGRIDGDVEAEKLFAGIMKREDCRQLYIQYYLSLMNYYYSEGHVKAALDEMHGSRASELTYMVENTDLLLNNFNVPDVTDMDYIAHQLFMIERFTQLRPEYAKQDLTGAFGDMTSYTLHLDNPDGASITVDYANMTETEFSGSYFEEIPVEISVCPRQGYELEYWLVNGEQVVDDVLTIDGTDVQDGQINITCVCSPMENADLCISGVKSKEGDFVEITNLSMESKNLGDYCLTDNSSDRKSTLPASIIEPGEKVTVYCKSYSEVEALGQPVTNFNIKAGEIVSLHLNDGTLVDSVTVPELGSAEGVWQKDMYTGLFKEVIPR